MKLEYKTKGVCARSVVLEINDGIIADVKIIGGCDGNHNGIVALVKGMRADDVIARLEGIRCGNRSTSCPDQLACALKAAIK